MSGQPHQMHEPHRATANDAAKTEVEGLAQARAQLHELLERGEISREAFAEYSATADTALALKPVRRRAGARAA